MTPAACVHISLAVIPGAPPDVQTSWTDAPVGTWECTFYHPQQVCALLSQLTESLRICQRDGVCYITAGKKAARRSAERWWGVGEQSCEARLLLGGVRWSRADSQSSLLSDCFQTDLHAGVTNQLFHISNSDLCFDDCLFSVACHWCWLLLWLEGFFKLFLLLSFITLFIWFLKLYLEVETDFPLP